MQIRPTEILTVKAAAAVINSTVIDSVPLIIKVVPRWILALAAGEAISHLATKDAEGNILSVNAWVLTTASWIPAKAKSDSGLSQTPKNVNDDLFAFTDGSPIAAKEDTAINRDYKINLTGSLKIWQLVQYEQGDDDANSEIQSMAERQAVIDNFSKNPRFGMEWFDFEHDELKFPALAIVPFGNSLIHIAQGNIPFNFSYVVSAT